MNKSVGREIAQARRKSAMQRARRAFVSELVWQQLSKTSCRLSLLCTGITIELTRWAASANQWPLDTPEDGI
jgi:hypothetical protein